MNCNLCKEIHRAISILSINLFEWLFNKYLVEFSINNWNKKIQIRAALNLYTPFNRLDRITGVF